MKTSESYSLLILVAIINLQRWLISSDKASSKRAYPPITNTSPTFSMAPTVSIDSPRLEKIMGGGV